MLWLHKSVNMGLLGALPQTANEPSEQPASELSWLHTLVLFHLGNAHTHTRMHTVDSQCFGALCFPAWPAALFLLATRALIKAMWTHSGCVLEALCCTCTLLNQHKTAFALPQPFKISFKGTAVPLLLPV